MKVNYLISEDEQYILIQEQGIVKICKHHPEKTGKIDRREKPIAKFNIIGKV